MRQRIVIRFGLVLCAMLGACAQHSGQRDGDGAAPQAQNSSPVSALSGDQPDTRIGELSPRVLQDGACGLFLWSREAQPKLVFFADDQGGKPAMHLDGQEASLTRTMASGAVFVGQYTVQAFQVADMHINLTFSVSEERPISRGLAVPQGVLKLKQTNGWEAVVPVAGLLACR